MLCENVNHRLCQNFGADRRDILSPRSAAFNATHGSIGRIAPAYTAIPPPPGRSILNPEQFVVLVGLMGAGKTSIGRRLADTLGIPFIDTDEEIVNAAGCSIADIFEIYGEQAFREVEERVMARILSETPSVVATGGGAFINDQTRDLIARHSISVWLKADLKILLERTKRRDSRPILKAGDPQKILRELMETRYPIYAEADLTVETGEESVSDTLQGIMAALETLMPTDGAKPNEV